MFTLGAITCPRCDATLTLSKFTAAAGGWIGEAILRCTPCSEDYQLTLTLLRLQPVAPRVDGEPIPDPDPGELLVPPELEGLEHVDGDHHQHHAADVKTADGFYPCPVCPRSPSLWR